MDALILCRVAFYWVHLSLGSLHFRVYVVPFHNISILATLANLALVYYMFLVGLELDIRPLVRAGTRALSISLAGILFAISVGWALHTYLLFRDFDFEKTKGST